MATIGNLIWFVLGGFVMGVGRWLAGLLMLISVVGILGLEPASCSATSASSRLLVKQSIAKS